jgi:hypothetical protein
MFSDLSGLDVLSEGESLQLLSSAAVGRVIYSERAMPFAVPVSFALVGMDIILATNHASALAANAAGNVVGFEADHIGSSAGTGWSVLATGRAELVSDPIEIARLAGLDLESWGAAINDRYLRIRIGLIRGRRAPGATVPPALLPHQDGTRSPS